MPLTGSLVEFPLPEVLLLIGSRTGRLRLFDAQSFFPMELDLSEGNAHGLIIEQQQLVEPGAIVAELSYAIESGEGFFEFVAQPVASVAREHPLAIGELVMQLVLHVDEKLARHRAVLAPELFYLLASPAPAADLKGDLPLFLAQSRHLLAHGVRGEDLADYLGLNGETVRLHLYHLHQLGLVRLIETTDVQALRESIVGEDISDKTHDYQVAVETSNLLRRTGRLLRLPALT